ncbi:MAG TPA: c-type cytochrome [Solirubrobacteraceae bacterium]|nr:c-type cytochrome [Solirubrobacteraceae bacterium]
MVDAGLVILLAALGLLSAMILFQGGPRRTRESLFAGSLPARLALQGAIFLAFAFGLAVPAVIIVFNGEDQAATAPGGVHLSASEQKGRVLFAQTCAFCHTLKASNAVGRTGPNLDVFVPTVGSTIAARKAFIESVINAGFAGRYGQMPAEIYRGREEQEVAEYVSAVAGK